MTKVYTKKGDKGQTTMIGGFPKVEKTHHRIEAYGNMDELNSFVGYLRDQFTFVVSTDEKDNYFEPIKFLEKIQNNIFVAESMMAINPNSRTEIRDLPKLTDADVTELENEIDRLTEKLPELKSFILPGGHHLISLTHICRTVCRRTERSIVNVINRETGSIPLRFIDEGDLVLRYFNRLSDYFFTLARAIAFEKGITETKWTTK